MNFIKLHIYLSLSEFIVVFNLVDDIQGVFVSLDCLGVEDSSTLDMLAPLFFKIISVNGARLSQGSTQGVVQCEAEGSGDRGRVSFGEYTSALLWLHVASVPGTVATL